jgi:glycosyltransferase involved in cell wall biosynthesis
LKGTDGDGGDGCNAASASEADTPPIGSMVMTMRQREQPADDVARERAASNPGSSETATPPRTRCRAMHIGMYGSEWFHERPGGLNRYFEQLAFHLAARSDVTLQAHAFGTPPHPWGDTLGPADRGMLRRQWNLAGRQGSSQVLDTHFPLYRPRRHRAAVHVAHFHGPWHLESAESGEPPLTIALKRGVERRYYRQMDAVICISRAFVVLAQETFELPAHRVHLIPPGVPEPRPISIARDPHLAVCVRRLEKRMGIDVLLRAWVIVKNRVPGARLEIIGDGSERAALQEMAHALGVGSSVSFMGRVTDDFLANAYARATCTVVPSVALEGFGLIALEAMTYGTPPIVTDCQGLPEAVRPLDESLVVPSRQPREMAERMVEAFRGRVPTPEECRNHGARYSWPSVAANHVSLYKELLMSQQ